MRRALAVGAVFNFLAVAVVLFPESIGKFANLPPAGSRFYPWLLSLFIGLFGALYAWLSRRIVIDRLLVTVAVIGKFGVFLVAIACLVLGDLSATAFAPAIGDLLFGFVFLWWLRGGTSI